MQGSPLSSSSIYPNAQPFFGIVGTTVQALRLVHAARLGVIPRVLRRLNGMERNEMIVSGAVFVFSVEESGIRRWTDGRLFSPSRIDGNFLTYREMNERRGGGRNPDDSTITVKIHGSDHHVISYYTQQDVESGRFRPMSSRADLMSLHLPPHIFTFSDFRFPPRVETGRDGLTRIVCEPEPPNVPSTRSVRGDTTSYPLARRVYVEHDVFPSSSTPVDALAPPSVVRNPNVASSSSRVRTESWSEQFDSSHLAPPYSVQETPGPSLAVSPEGRYGDEQVDTSSPAVIYGTTMPHPTQRWPLRPPHFTHYDMSQMPSETCSPSSQLPDSGGTVQFSGGMGQVEAYGYNRETRQMAEEEPVWLPDTQNDVRNPNSGALDLSNPWLHHG